MGIEQGIQLLQESVNWITVFSIEGIISLIILLITMLIATRDFNKWKILLLPTTIAYAIIGLNIPFEIWLISSIVFAIEILSYENLMGGITKVIENKVKIPKYSNPFKKTIKKTFKETLKDGTKVYDNKTAIDLGLKEK